MARLRVRGFPVGSVGNVRTIVVDVTAHSPMSGVATAVSRVSAQSGQKTGDPVGAPVSST